MIRIKFKKAMHTPSGQEWLDIDLTISKGGFISLFGESGAGKTTFLRIIAGLTQPQEGYIEVDGETWFDSQRGINFSIQQRRVGFVFQENYLFHHMNVRENLEYACANKMQREGIDEWVSSMGLKGLVDRMPDQLSGGQKQRVALIRALINQPKILLLDEPLSSLDMNARLNIQDEISKIYQKTGITTILVSHDLPEVFRLSQQVFVIEYGKIIKSGKTKDVFMNQDLKGRFKFKGEVIDIQKDGLLNIVTLSVGNNVMRVLMSDEEMEGLKEC